MLVRLYGYILTVDSRIVTILYRTGRMKIKTVKKLDLDKNACFIGSNRFGLMVFPKAFNLANGKEKDFDKLLS